MTLFEFAASRALRAYRTAPPGYRIKRRREWVLAMARSLV